MSLRPCAFEGKVHTRIVPDQVIGSSGRSYGDKIQVSVGIVVHPGDATGFDEHIAVQQVGTILEIQAGALLVKKVCFSVTVLCAGCGIRESVIVVITRRDTNYAS